jgi:rhamnogalacturonan endolyase
MKSLRLSAAPALLALLTLACAPTFAADPVATRQTDQDITLDNGVISIVVSKEDGSLKAIRKFSQGAWHDLGVTKTKAAYGAHGDDFANDPDKAMYWDANADVIAPPPGLKPAVKGYFRIGDGQARVVVKESTPQRAEVVVSAAPTPLFPFEADYHFVLQQGQSGYYVYAEIHHGADQPAATFYQNRFVVKTVMDGTFDTWASGDGQFIPIPQAAIAQQVSDATFRLADGSVKTKYMNSVYWSQVPVYGYVGKHLGLWAIEASPEYHNGGPVKQGQTLHDNVLLRVMQSVHFGAAPVQLAKGEEWRKVYGPFLVYANEADGAQALWQDASREQKKQAAAWPYAWVDSPAYARQRGAVRGEVKLDGKPAAGAWAILSEPGVAWTAQTKGYAYWVRTDAQGRFELNNVAPGDYALSLSGADQPRDLVLPDIHVDAGAPQDLGGIAWSGDHHGKLLWQIGRFDRSAAEFRDGGNARQFEMYRHYPQAFPDDVDFHVGRDEPGKAWNYAQWTAYSHQPAWHIRFTLPAQKARNGIATLTVGFASAQPARGKKETDLRVTVNGREVAAVHLPKTGTAGYRGGAQDSPYHLRQIRFEAALLKNGENVIGLAHADALPFGQFTQAAADNPATISVTPGQVMYDALKLEVEGTAQR